MLTGQVGTGLVLIAATAFVAAFGWLLSHMITGLERKVDKLSARVEQVAVALAVALAAKQGEALHVDVGALAGGDG